MKKLILIACLLMAATAGAIEFKDLILRDDSTFKKIITGSIETNAADGTHYLSVHNGTALTTQPVTNGIIFSTYTGMHYVEGTNVKRMGSGGTPYTLPTATTSVLGGVKVDGITVTISNGVISSASASAGYVSAPTYSDQTCTAGQYATDASYYYLCKSSNVWDRVLLSTWLAAWSNPTPSTPTLSSATIASNGTSLTLVMSLSTSVGAGGSGGVDVDCTTAGQNIAATYASGAPGTSLVYTLASTVNSSDTCNVDYIQPTNGLEGTTGGSDVATIASTSITNNSTQSAGGPNVYYYSSAGATPANDQGIGSNTLLIAGAVTATSGGSITKIGIYARTYEEAPADNTVKMTLWKYSGGVWVSHECGTINITRNATKQWLDFTLSTPFTVGAGETVRVAFIADDTYGTPYYGYGASTGGFYVAGTYAAGCSTTPPSFGDDNVPGVRIYVD